MFRVLLAGLVAAVLLSAAEGVKAAIISDYFAYGASDAALHGANGGVGWSTAWQDPGTGSPPTDPYVLYDAHTNLQFSNPAYAYNGENTQGAIANSRDNTGGDVSYTAYRHFDTGLSGTIWLSGLARAATDTGSILLWFEPSAGGSSGNNAIGFFEHLGKDRVWIKYAGSADFAANPYHDNMTADYTYLYLAKIEMNYDGTKDRLTYWIKDEAADLSSEGSLGVPLFSKEGSDAFGPTLDSVGLSFNRTDGLFDALRIGDTYASVVGPAAVVPEPSGMTLCLLAVGLFAPVCRHRTRKETP